MRYVGVYEGEVDAGGWWCGTRLWNRPCLCCSAILNIEHVANQRVLSPHTDSNSVTAARAWDVEALKLRGKATLTSGGSSSRNKLNFPESLKEYEGIIAGTGGRVVQPSSHPGGAGAGSDAREHLDGGGSSGGCNGGKGALSPTAASSSAAGVSAGAGAAPMSSLASCHNTRSSRASVTAAMMMDLADENSARTESLLTTTSAAATHTTGGSTGASSRPKRNTRTFVAAGTASSGARGAYATPAAASARHANISASSSSTAFVFPVPSPFATATNRASTATATAAISSATEQGMGAAASSIQHIGDARQPRSGSKRNRSGGPSFASPSSSTSSSASSSLMATRTGAIGGGGVAGSYGGRSYANLPLAVSSNAISLVPPSSGRGFVANEAVDAAILAMVQQNQVRGNGSVSDNDSTSAAGAGVGVGRVSQALMQHLHLASPTSPSMLDHDDGAGADPGASSMGNDHSGKVAGSFASTSIGGGLDDKQQALYGPSLSTLLGTSLVSSFNQSNAAAGSPGLAIKWPSTGEDTRRKAKPKAQKGRSGSTTFMIDDEQAGADAARAAAFHHVGVLANEISPELQQQLMQFSALQQQVQHQQPQSQQYGYLPPWMQASMPLPTHTSGYPVMMTSSSHPSAASAPLWPPYGSLTANTQFDASAAAYHGGTGAVEFIGAVTGITSPEAGSIPYWWPTSGTAVLAGGPPLPYMHMATVHYQQSHPQEAQSQHYPSSDAHSVAPGAAAALIGNTNNAIGGSHYGRGDHECDDEGMAMGQDSDRSIDATSSGVHFDGHATAAGLPIAWPAELMTVADGSGAGTGTDAADSARGGHNTTLHGIQQQQQKETSSLHPALVADNSAVMFSLRSPPAHSTPVHGPAGADAASNVHAAGHGPVTANATAHVQRSSQPHPAAAATSSAEFGMTEVRCADSVSTGSGQHPYTSQTTSLAPPPIDVVSRTNSRTFAPGGVSAAAASAGAPALVLSDSQVPLEAITSASSLLSPDHYHRRHHQHHQHLSSRPTAAPPSVIDHRASTDAANVWGAAGSTSGTSMFSMTNLMRSRDLRDSMYSRAASAGGGDADAGAQHPLAVSGQAKPRRAMTIAAQARAHQAAAGAGFDPY